MKKTEHLRFGIILLVFFFLYGVLVTRLLYWQTVKAEGLKNIGIKQSSQVLTIPAIRGEIMSSDNFPLATNTISYLAYTNPKLIKDKEYTAGKIASILNVDAASVSAQLSKDLFWVRLGQNLDNDTKTKLEALKVPGLGFEEEYTRFYPEASMAAHLVGFVGRNADGNHEGYFGIEGRYNEQLAGRDGANYAIRDALGNDIVGDIRESPKIDGRNIKLTIDRSVQYFAQKALLAGVQKYEADGASVIIMEPTTGKILGMASYPDFDPQTYYDFDTKSYTNPILSSLYEPGSTFKVLVMGAAIDKGLVTPQTRCNICDSPVKIGEYDIRTWNNQYIPNISMNDVIIHSDNTGMVFVSRKLGLSTMIDYFHRYGLGKPTGVDLQGETTGVIKDEKDWYTIDLATASFGQGISLTPIQLVTAVNSIANGGKLMQPYVVDQITTPDGKTIDIKPKEKNRTISTAAAKTVTSMMVDAVEKGEAQWTKIKGYKIAGKTGTAQIPVAGHYDPNQTVASFVGFFPAHNPKVTMLVVVHKPKTSIYGAETAAPIFFNIARDLIKYYNIPSN